MAKIPRINQGDRPSAAGAHGGPDMSAVNIARVLGGVADAALDVATHEELAQRRIQYDAMMEKQKIVDASEAGRISTDFDGVAFSIQAQLEQDPKFQAHPELLPEELKKQMREQANALQDENVVPANPQVRLAVVRSAESTMSSQYQKSFGWVSARQTEIVKSNLVREFNSVVAGAADQPSAVAAEIHIASNLARMKERIANVHGNLSGAEEDRLWKQGAQAYGEMAAMHRPAEFLAELDVSPFLRESLGDDVVDMRRKANAGYHKLRETHDMDIVKEAAAAGEVLVGLIGRDEFVPTAAKRMRSLEEQRKNAKIGVDQNGGKLRDGDIGLRMALIDRQIERVKVLQAMSYKQLDSAVTDDPATVGELVVKQNEFTAKTAKTSVKENLRMLEAQTDALTEALNLGRITRGTFNTMHGKLVLMRQGAIDEQKSNDGFWFMMDSEEEGVNAINKLLKETTHSGTPDEVQNNIWVEYTRRITAAKKAGGLTDAQAIKIAQQVVSRESGKRVKGAFD